MDRRINVLLVEDNLISLEMASAMLESAGYNVLRATEAEGAIRVALAQRPELILLDIGLPGRDGFHVLRTLRREGFKNTPIVAATAYRLEDERENIMRAGFDGCISKPFFLEDFLAQVAEYARNATLARRN